MSNDTCKQISNDSRSAHLKYEGTGPNYTSNYGYNFLPDQPNEIMARSKKTTADLKKSHFSLGDN